jgi:FO synthase
VTYSRKVFIPLTRLCRDRCHYCTFATVPHRLPSAYLEIDEVLDVAKRGAELGCKEALFTLGDRPEDRWPQAREWLDARGFASTLDYVRAAAIAVLERTGLLPHLNPGVLSWEELTRLKPVAPSMGMMLETTSRRLYAEPGQPHFGSPDKDPEVRIRVLEDAGRVNVPFTTGLLIGIGETLAERVDGLFTIRRIERQFHGIQEVIIQNFRAKADTAMRNDPDATVEDLVATIAVARLVLGPRARIQAPPNLVNDQWGLVIRAGIDDWGGVSPLTADHVNPERPWPEIERLEARTAEAGFALRERLAVYPPYVAQADPWLDPRIRPHVLALAGSDGLADAGAPVVGRPWQEPESAWSDGSAGGTGRTDLHETIDTTGRTSDRRSDFDAAYGDWETLRADMRSRAPDTDTTRAPRIDVDIAAALRSAERDPGALSDAHALALITARGRELDAVAALANQLRIEAVGDTVTYVVNRNINFTNVCYTGCRFCAFAQRKTDADAFTLSLHEVGERAAEAQRVGATEVCMQGGIHPDLPGTAYLDLALAVKRRAPGIHLHAYSPMEVVNGATRMNVSIREFLVAARESGVDSLPGTAAEILDDDVRWVLTKGKLPARTWIEVVRTAHGLGIPTTATMMYGHVDDPRHWVAHLRTLGRIQDDTGGFTEFVPLPFVHTNAPIYLAGIARPGPSYDDNRAVHAVARILLHGRIRNIQTSWVKLGVDGCVDMLNAGVNDVGGTLMEETISRMAGSSHGSAKTPAELMEIARRAGRPVRERTTLYGEPAGR